LTVRIVEGKSFAGGKKKSRREDSSVLSPGKGGLLEEVGTQTVTLLPSERKEEEKRNLRSSGKGKGLVYLAKSGRGARLPAEGAVVVRRRGRKIA